jgi:hypothetical protein
MSFEFLHRRVGFKTICTSILGLALVLFLISRIRNGNLADDCYMAVFFSAVIFLPTLFASLGFVSALRGRLAVKSILQCLGVAACFVPMWILVPPFFIFLPIGVLFFIYGVAGAIGYWIHRHRKPVA